MPADIVVLELQRADALWKLAIEEEKRQAAGRPVFPVRLLQKDVAIRYLPPLSD